MKSLYLPLVILLGCLCAAPVKQAPRPKEPPAGVPADAKEYQGKWYRVYLETLPWDRAKRRCEELGGQLAVVPDAAAWAFIRGLAGDARVWLGATDEETQGVWKWIDGTPFTFKAWLPGQPDNAKLGQEHYLHIHYGREARKGRGWNDATNDGIINERLHVVGFICEWKELKKQ